LATAAAAHVAILEVQSAGDGTTTGAALRRISLAISTAQSTARAVGLDLGAPQVVTDLQTFTSAARGDILPAQVTAPATITVTASSPLTAWANGPFVVVVGTGEHRAAIADASALAERFMAAWAAHAGGVPPRITDEAYRAADWRGHHLVLIGSARSNRVIQRLLPNVPLAWDDRQVTFTANGLTTSAHRSVQPAIAMVVPRPDAPDCVALVLDGSPAWSEPAGALPFATSGTTTFCLRVPKPGPQAPLESRQTLP